jgi:hypothetical protein
MRSLSTSTEGVMVSWEVAHTPGVGVVRGDVRRVSAQYGVQPNNHTISLALVGCKRLKRWDTALSMLRELRDQQGLQLSVVVYNSVSEWWVSKQDAAYALRRLTRDHASHAEHHAR